MPREHERKMHFVEVVLKSASGRREVRLSDVSLGGCFVETISELEPGEKISFDIAGPNGEPITFTGTVVYRMPGVGFGLKFDELNDEQRDFLKNDIGVSEGGDQ